MERCTKCNKKSHVMCTCTCQKVFCMKCRMPEDHGCLFDHKAAHRKLLELQNPKVVTKKVESV